MTFQKRALVPVSTLCSALLAISCGIKKDNDVDTHTDVQPVVPSVDATMDAPQSILYTQNSAQVSSPSLSKIPIIGQTLTALGGGTSGTLNTATGDGGLGVDLDSTTHTLTAYEGIPIHITSENVDSKNISVKVTGSGDSGCESIFTYDASNASNTIIRIDNTKITKLTRCSVTTEVSGVSQDKIVSKESKINVVLNPTLAMYASKNDPTFNYLRTVSALNDIDLIAQWIKDPARSEKLDLSFKDSYKTKGVNLADTNALTGAQNIRHIDLSGTNVKDILGLTYINNIQGVILSNTKLEASQIESLSGNQNITELDVSSTGLKDLKNITNNFKNLSSLNISNNPAIEDLSDIENLTKLKILKASNINLGNFTQLSKVTQISELDVSNNDLSSLTISDAQYLVNLYNLSSLNISGTHLSDDFVNTYLNNISSRDTLKTFIDRYVFEDGVYYTGECSKRINNWSMIGSLSLVTSLEWVELAGNACRESVSPESGIGKPMGILDTNAFVRMRNLQYLDISNTLVEDLSGLSGLKNLKTLILYNAEAPAWPGIGMTEEACLTGPGPAMSLRSDCYKLGNGELQSKTFTLGKNDPWKVPDNVYSITITGCSGANGGAGGGGGGGGAGIDDSANSYGGYGGASGTTNGLSNAINGDLGAAGYGTVCSMILYGDVMHAQYCTKSNQAPYGIKGENGELGEITYFGAVALDPANISVQRDPKTACLGGINGDAGSGGKGMSYTYTDSNGHYWVEGGKGGNGGKNTEAPWSSPIISKTIPVKPGQVFDIFVGSGGHKGAKGTKGVKQCSPPSRYGYGCGLDGSDGFDGTDGSNGFLKVEWNELEVEK